MDVETLLVASSVAFVPPLLQLGLITACGGLVPSAEPVTRGGAGPRALHPVSAAPDSSRHPTTTEPEE
jgi:hypothetical protein